VNSCNVEQLAMQAEGEKVVTVSYLKPIPANSTKLRVSVRLVLFIQ
jgi:hypothetical protein